jgi:16S rRNA (guanine966-N2)-methyltransferase
VALEAGWITDDALIVWEENAPMQPPAGFDLEGHRKYGDTHVTLLWRNVAE